MKYMSKESLGLSIPGSGFGIYKKNGPKAKSLKNILHVMVF